MDLRRVVYYFIVEILDLLDELALVVLRGASYSPEAVRCGIASTASRGPRRLSWDHNNGVEAPRSRDDAIFMNAVSPTRRDGPDAVRNSSNSKKKPPPAIIPGHDARRCHAGGVGVEGAVKF